ncbi:MAG: hypothetical protein LBK13_08290, partial [Spirochaetales bacterium]|nr:hypothetical protein [Spirochaetales bacterium]
KIAVYTEIFSFRTEKQKVNVFSASLMGNLLTQIASAWFHAHNCLWQLCAPGIAKGNSGAWF